MNADRPYPETESGPFPEPPVEFADNEDRPITVRAYESDDLEALVSMYVDFDPADRAQGIPPIGRDRIESWLATLVDGEALNVLAWHDDEVAGHATLVPDDTDAYELAIFVHQDYQRAGIGGRLIRNLLGAGAARGVERVWLTVERWNDAAVGLYESVGFERTGDARFEVEMTLRLA